MTRVIAKVCLVFLVVNLLESNGSCFCISYWGWVWFEKCEGHSFMVTSSSNKLRLLLWSLSGFFYYNHLRLYSSHICSISLWSVWIFTVPVAYLQNVSLELHWVSSLICALQQLAILPVDQSQQPLKSFWQASLPTNDQPCGFKNFFLRVNGKALQVNGFNFTAAWRWICQLSALAVWVEGLVR